MAAFGSMADLPHPSLFREVAFDKVRLHSSFLLSGMDMVRNHLEVSVRLDQIVRGMLLDLRSLCLGLKAERVDIEEQWPADWWQAFKERWFFAWMQQRWPVVYRKISIHKDCWRVCPHLNVTCPQGNMVHINYLEGKP